MEAREADLAGLGDPPRPGIGLLLVVHVHELCEDGDPRVLVQDVLPEVGRGHAVLRRRVASSVVMPLVEGQEECVRAPELGGHVDVVLGECEVHQCTSMRGQQRFTGWRAVRLVLLDGRLQRLREVRLDLNGRHGQPVEEQHQVDPVALPRRVADLLHHPHPVLRVALRDPGIAVVCGRGCEHAELLCPGDRETATKRIEGATAGLFRLPQLGRQAIQNPALALGAGGVIPVLGHDPGVLLRLRVLQPAENVLGEQRPLFVVALGVGGVGPPVPLQVLRDLPLERLFLMRCTHAYSLCRPCATSASSCSAAGLFLAETSICPVTAAVMRAARRSRARSIAC